MSFAKLGFNDFYSKHLWFKIKRFFFFIENSVLEIRGSNQVSLYVHVSRVTGYTSWSLRPDTIFIVNLNNKLSFIVIYLNLIKIDVNYFFHFPFFLQTFLWTLVFFFFLACFNIFRIYFETQLILRSKPKKLICQEISQKTARRV